MYIFKHSTAAAENRSLSLFTESAILIVEGINSNCQGNSVSGA